MRSDLSLDVSRVALKRRRTKIVATLGPASWSPKTLDALIAAGVNVFRLNFSHGTHEQHGRTYKRVRSAARRAGLHVAVLADLCGPKIRVGEFDGGGIDLSEGADVIVTTRKVRGAPGLVPSQYAALHGDVRKGDRILLDDGNLELQVRSVRGRDVRCGVVAGGRLKDHKGMNLPGVAVSAPSLTRKDRTDARFAVGLGVDYLALSFVRAAKDVTSLRRLVEKEGADTPIVAKIEKPEALDAIASILEVSDGIMVARGDLGVELPVEEVPLVQRELVRVAIEANRPVIMATQMLESMIEHPRPTRAEATDVAAAAMAGADAVMLSGETAAGRYPVEAVATMDRVLRLVEGYQWKHGQFATLLAHRKQGAVSGEEPLDVPEALSRATSLLSRGLAVHAVVVPTKSGTTARWVSGERPAAPVLCVSRDAATCRRAMLYWGVTPLHAAAAALENPPELARTLVRDLGLAETGDPVLLVWDSSTDLAGTQPTITVLTI